MPSTRAKAKPTHMAAQPAQQQRGLLGLLLAWALHRVWFVQPDLLLTVTINPTSTMQVLLQAAKPRRERLELGQLFADGRRYFFRQRSNGGFSMITTSKVPWHSSNRTNAAAVVFGDFTAIGQGADANTRILLRGRIKTLYLLSVFAWPTFMTSIIIFLPWSPTLILSAIVGLFVLSWLGHRNNAALEAAEMVYFIEKVLEDYIPAPTPKLVAENADLVYKRRDFARAWERFYEEHVEP